MSQEEFEEQDEAPRRRHGFIVNQLRTNPRNFIVTVGMVAIIGSMLVNGLTHTPSLRNKSRGDIEAEKAQTPNTTPAGAQTVEPQTRAGYEAEITRLTQRLESLEAALNNRPAEAQPPMQTQNAIAALGQRIADQEETITALHHELQAVSSLRANMEAMETRASRKLASLTLFGQLRDAANRGDAFKPMLDQLLELNKSNPQANALLMQLLPVASTGLHSPEELKKQFGDTAHLVLRHASGNSFTDKLKGLIRIRRIGEQTGMDDESILARAEIALKEGDIHATLKELDALSPGGKKAMAAWIRNAKEYTSAQDTFTALQGALAYTGPVPAEQEPAPQEEAMPAPQEPTPAPEELAPSAPQEQPSPQAAEQTETPAPEAQAPAEPAVEAPQPQAPEETVPAAQEAPAEMPRESPPQAQGEEAPAPAPETGAGEDKEAE